MLELHLLWTYYLNSGQKNYLGYAPVYDVTFRNQQPFAASRPQYPAHLQMAAFKKESREQKILREEMVKPENKTCFDCGEKVLMRVGM